MRRHFEDDYDDEDEGPYVVIEKRSGGLGSFFIVLAVCAGIALLFAPRSGEQTRAWNDLVQDSRRIGLLCGIAG